MRILGHNLLPFSVAQLTSGWAATASNGIFAECFFFSEDMPTDWSPYLIDFRQLLRRCAGACEIKLRPETEGLTLLLDQSVGFKALSGSVYKPQMGVTLHYPRDIQPIGYTAAGTDIPTGYASGVATGNRRLLGNVSRRPQVYPGFPLDTQSQPIYTVAASDVEFDSAVTINAFVAPGPDLSAVVSGNITPVTAQDAGGMSTTLGSAVAWSIGANQEGNVIASPPAAGTRWRISQAVGTARRGLPATQGNTSPATKTATLKWALVAITDTNYGSLAAGVGDVQYFACSVGVTGAGTIIELQSLTLNVGEFPVVTQVRTATEIS